MTHKTMITLFLATCCFLLGTHDAHAYLDPGTGSFILQMLVGAMLAAMVALKMYWQKFKAFLRRDKEEKTTETPRELTPAPADEKTT